MITHNVTYYPHEIPITKEIPLVTQSTMTERPTFPIPSSFHELEHSPYNLLPYPHDFDDDDEAARAESFDRLINAVEVGNNELARGGLQLFLNESSEEDFDVWNDGLRIQALYTLVRKSDSLALVTRSRLVKALCDAVESLSDALATSSAPLQRCHENCNESQQGCDSSPSFVVSQEFRDAYACHIYMLFTFMFFTESKEKLGKSLGNSNQIEAGSNKKKGTKGTSRSKISSTSHCPDYESILSNSRSLCATAMRIAAQTMSKFRSRLWKRSVPDEAVVGLPCRIAYILLESASGATGRKASYSDAALQIIACTVDSAPCLLNTIVTGLVDLLHTYEHVAPLAAELCCLVNESPVNILAVEMLREIARLDPLAIDGGSASSDSGKASGIKNIAPFISELASVRPKVVLANISLLIPHLDSEPYVLRSAIVYAIGSILVRDDVSLVEEDEKVIRSRQSEDNRNIENECKEDRKIINMVKTRSSLFGILCERAYDITSFTRAAALKVLNELTEKQSLPLDNLMPVTEIAIDRLQDKTVMVRRYSMQLLTSLLENNPFMGLLNPQPYRDKLRELEVYLIKNMPEDILQAKEAALQGTVCDGNSLETELDRIESAAMLAAIADVESKKISNELSETEIDYFAKVKALKYSSSALAFIELFENANASFHSMLMSSNSSDVTEALRFFVKAKHYGLPCAVTGTKRALTLMWSNEVSIQDEVLLAFIDVFVAEPGTEGKELLPENQIAQNFLDLVGEATVSELACIEEAIGRLVKKEIIPPEVFSILWQMVTQAVENYRASAMLVISMAASADPKIVDSSSRLQNLYEAGLGDYTEDHRDWKTARSAAYALQRVARTTTDTSSAKFIILELIIERLVAVARGDWCEDENPSDTNAWFCAAEQAINAIFTISASPEKVCAEVLQGHQNCIFGKDGESSQVADSLRLSRFFFVIGHIALKLLIYTEILNSSVRHAHAAKTIKKQESASGGISEGKSGKVEKESVSNNEAEDAIEAELGIAAQAEAETERMVAEISENEIVGRGIISLYTPMLLRVVANEEGKFSSPVLIQSATLALCKCMCVSKSFCEKHLPLLFSVLTNAPNDDQDLRANIVIALGDLAFRFPNEVEPYTPKIYACLRDNSTRVRRHTLMVLTHLILNDMVKVKGNVCEIALCLQDDEAGIRDMARLLFHELSKRTNSPIYNLLPDIVSQLSLLHIKRETFREIMSFLLSFIKKDRQNEMLTDKLLQRFPKCTSINQKADLAYCISQLKINDKCIKCLNDSFKLYSDALFDEDVLRNFLTVVSKAKKNAKLDTKDIIQELEDKLNEHATAGVENVNANKKAQRAKARAAKRVARKKKEWEGESDEDEFISDSEEMNEENISNNIIASPVEQNVTMGSTFAKSTKRIAHKSLEDKVVSGDDLEKSTNVNVLQSKKKGMPRTTRSRATNRGTQKNETYH